MGIPYFQPKRRDDGHWRILCTQNGITADLCGAITEAVAWDECAILNAMRRGTTVTT